MIRNRKIAKYASILAAVALVAAAQSRGQQATNPGQTSGTASNPTTPSTNPPAAPAASDESESEIVKLTPFEVSAGAEQGYNAATTLAGNRLNTELRDIGNAVSVVTKQFLTDTGAVDNKSLLQYLPSGEVGSVYGNFSGVGDSATPDESSKFINPNQNTRVRGLTSADNTRDYFLTDIPWDGYNIDRVDFQRGPNSILFGQGSPAGIINAGTQPASYKDSGSLEMRVGSFGSTRQVLNINKVILPNELALRVALLRNDEEYKQEPAFSLDKRLFAATRWEPRWLNRGSARTIFKADIEFGDIKSNNPRDLPPYDNVTPWFYTGTYQGLNVANQPFTYNYLNKLTLNSSQNEDDNTGFANHGQNRPSHNGGPQAGQPNEWFNPWIGNFGQQFGSLLMTFNNDATNLQKGLILEPSQYWAINSAGVRTGGVYAFTRPPGVVDYAGFAKNARLPFWDYGVYKDKSLTDPSVFDFYNNLLDGPNKNEWQNFRAYTLDLQQTFFDDQLGIDATYNNEWWKGGQEGILTSWKAGIQMDMVSVYSDGTPDYGITHPGQAFANGTPNPNVGRPFIEDSAQFSNNQTISNRESSRVTAYARHDFAHDGWLPKVVGEVLGSHTVTGLWAQDEQDSDYRQWQRYGTDASYKAFLGTNPNFTDNGRTPNPVIYLGPSLSSRSSASGANIPRIMDEISMPKTAQVYLFDSHWNRPTDPNAPGYVNPAAPWTNGYYPSDSGSYVATQSINPANYVGWVNRTVNITNADDSQAARDLLTYTARLTKNQVKSKALVWQGHFWNNFLVATGGIRKDSASGWSTSEDTNIAGTNFTSDANLNLTPQVYHFYDDPKAAPKGLSVGAPTHIDVTSKSWSLVAHLTDLFPNNLPIRVSGYYARSTNFQPFSNRVDVYGHAIGAPEGKTTEKGVLLETRDNKYSLKIDRYVTESVNQSSTGLNGTWFIGASQAWAANWVNRFQYNWTSDTIAGAVAVNDPNNSEYNYAPAPGETLADAQKREASVIAAWRTYQASVNPDFYKAWNINLNDNTKSVAASNPAGFAVTENSTSKGYEIELNAQITRNWRLSFNASKTDAVRQDVGGAALTDFISKYETALSGGKPGTVGDLRIWWGGSGNETTLQEWNGNIGSEYHQRKLEEGTNVPELRKWRYNLVTNYGFDHGILKGVGVGGGLRYQSDIVIGYAPFYVDPNDHSKGVSFNLTDPYRGPSETAIDAWISYQRKLTAKIEWVLQLNVRNLNYGGDALIPVTVQPDGSGALYRIRPPRTWELTNTFRF